MKPLLWPALALTLAAGAALSAAPRSNGGKEIAYGQDAKQRLDYWPAARGSLPPLMIFIHGGGWSVGDKAYGGRGKPGFYTGLGYAFASLNYRLVPNVTPDDQAKDIAAAVAHLRSNARRLGFDPNRIYLMGHSAGAHLAALVSANTSYLDQAGVPVTAIIGTVLLDGAGYDVPKQMANKENRLPGMYAAAFSNDKAVQTRLSPISYASAPNSPRWLILHVATRPDSASQSKALGSALSGNGTSTVVKAIPDSTHFTINRDAGKASTIVGDEIEAFLKRR